MVLIIILYINCSITVISSEEDEKIPIGIDNVTVIPETQLDVDDFQLVITQHQKRRMQYKEFRLQMDEIMKGLADNGTDEESSGEF